MSCSVVTKQNNWRIFQYLNRSEMFSEDFWFDLNLASLLYRRLSVYVSVYSHDHSLTLGNKSSLHHKRVLRLIRTRMQKYTHPHSLTHRWESFCFVLRLQSRLSQQQVKLSVNCSPRASLLYSVLSAV